jgi:hypothetical protein
LLSQIFMTGSDIPRKYRDEDSDSLNPYSIGRYFAGPNWESTGD